MWLLKMIARVACIVCAVDEYRRWWRRSVVSDFRGMEGTVKSVGGLRAAKGAKARERYLSRRLGD